MDIDRIFDTMLGALMALSVYNAAQAVLIRALDELDFIPYSNLLRLLNAS